MIKELRLSNIAISVIMLAAGIVLLWKPATSLQIICYAIAAVLVLLALTRIVAYIRLKKESTVSALVNALIAVILFIAALFVFLRWQKVAGILPTVLGVLIMVDGVMLIITGIAYHKYMARKGLASLLPGLICVIGGYFAISHSFETQLFLMRFVGGSLIASAVFNLINQVLIERADTMKRNVTTVDFDTMPQAPAPEPEATVSERQMENAAEETPEEPSADIPEDNPEA
ncbi:MAG: DUF308 domain-containing protein [Mogibacterium sp.]|nr:DUF308 domain-containing protein [Mogibacterium sp.]